MRRSPPPDRRAVLKGSAALLGAALLGGCDRLSNAPWFRDVIGKDDDANRFVQRLLLKPAQLAPEYAEADVSPWFKPNGTDNPTDKGYRALVAQHFENYRLTVDGLVERASTFSLADLRAMPSRTQITRHDCVEGWSCIGKWTGVPLSEILNRVGLKPNARFIVFRCADVMDDGSDDGSSGDDSSDDDADSGSAGGTSGGTNGSMVKSNGGGGSEGGGSGDASSGGGGGDSGDGAEKPATVAELLDSIGTDESKVRYYESIDLTDAYHPQTILAYEMNGKTLPVAHGAPLRLRLERQLGYKMAKYVMRLQVVDALDDIGEGKGGYWEDQGYEWYAGI